MERRGDEVHVESTEASGGSKEGVVRWVLIIGTLLAIVLLSAIWMTGAAFQGDVEEEATVSGKISADSEAEGDSTDSIVSDNADEMAAPPDPAAEPVVENRAVDASAVDQSAQSRVREQTE
jgi:hypothetical protein